MTDYRKLRVQEMNRLSVEAFRSSDKTPLIAILDNVRSQHNVGAVFRTADAFRLAGVWLCGICCTPPNDEIHKTALGAEETVDWRYFEDTRDAVRLLHEQGWKVYAVEQTTNSLTPDCFRPDGPTAVVFGHEVFGVQQEVIDLSDGTIEIPQFGTKHSLNVSVTAGIILYELSHQLRQ